jgi:Zn-dependent peptidase ImmA (M78 family)
MSFESEQEQPTYAQLAHLAHKLDRPPAFFLVDPPTRSDIPTTIDYRGAGSNAVPKLTRELKRAAEHRLALLDLDPSLPSSKLPALTDDPAKAARDLRESMLLQPLDVPQAAGAQRVLTYWIDCFESQGILIFQTTGIPLDAFRGVSVYYATLPIVILNGSDSAFGKVFSLLHEIGHLATRTSGLCTDDESSASELLCNQFAQEFLMPLSAVQQFAETQTLNPFYDAMSMHFGVSSLAAAVRLRGMNLISEKDLEQARAQSNEAWRQLQQQRAERNGAPSFHVLRYRDLGHLYVGAVATALAARELDLLDASYLLNTKVEGVHKIVELYYRDSRTK